MSAFCKIGFGILALVVLVVYSPSLKHAPRGDQAVYLAEVAHQKDFKSLVFDDYDLNRTRQFNPGDEVLFRPFLYAFLGAEKYFFGYNFAYWHLTGIMLHLMVVFCFLKIALKFCGPLPALSMAAVFALLSANMEMVVWDHVNAYLLALVLTLIALYHCIGLMEGAGEDRRIYTICAALLAGVFIYEPVNAFAVIICVFLWLARPDLRPKSLLVMAPVVLYVLLGLYNFFIVHQFSYKTSGLLTGISLHEVVQTMCWWSYVGWFFFLYPLFHGSRTMYYPDDVLKIKDFGGHPLALVSLVPVVLLLVLIVVAFKHKFYKQRRNAALIAVCLVSYAFIIAIRGSEQSLRDNLYCQYIYWLFLWLLVCVSLDWKEIQKRFALLAVIFCAAMAFYAVMSGVRLYYENLKRALQDAPRMTLIHKANDLIRSEGLTPGFSFYIPPAQKGNQVYRGIKKKSDPPAKEYSYFELLYPQYFTQYNPKHFLSL